MAKLNKSQKIKLLVLIILAVLSAALLFYTNQKAPADEESMKEVVSIINEAKMSKNGDALIMDIKAKQQDGINNQDVAAIKNAYENWKVGNAIKEAESTQAH